VNDLPGDDALPRRAIDYPDTRPHGSFRFHPGSDRVEPLDESELADLCRDRHPVVAVGSTPRPSSSRARSRPASLLAVALIAAALLVIVRLRSDLH
jgi:hypothetical protein